MRVLVGLWFVCVVLWVTMGFAQAQDGDPALKAFREGVTHFDAGEFDKALAAFNEANHLNPSWKLLYNIGQCEAALRKFGLALTHFERYLSEGGDAVPAERRDGVLAEVERLRKMVGSIELEAPDGAVVLVDGVERGQAPLPGRLRLSASVEHVITVVLDEQQLLERTVMVGGGETITVKADSTEAAPEDEAEPIAEPDVLEESDSSSLKTWGWVTLGLGAAVAAGGGITGGLALKTNGELADRCAGGVCNPGDQSDIDKRDSLAMTSNVLIGVGAAAVVAGVLMLVLGGDEEPEGEVVLRPMVAPGLAGAAARWRF